MYYWLTSPRALHRTWFVGAGCSGILIGLVSVKTGLLLGGIWSVAIGIILLIASLKRSRLALILILLSGLLIGSWQGSRVELQLSAVRNYVGQNKKVSGKVAGDTNLNQRQQQEFYLNNLVIDGQNRPGKLRVSTFNSQVLARGDRVVVSGKLLPSQGSAQVRMNFAQVQLTQPSKSKAIIVRDSFAAAIKSTLPEPHASLALGFLLGQKNELPDELNASMRTLALTHIVVASGYNLTILVRVARRRLARISKFQAFAGSIILISGFIAVTGLSPSMVRAGFVTMLSLAAWYYGRRIHPIVLLLFAAAVTALLNPIFIWEDIGWYLSFLAFAGVLVVAPLLCAFMFKTIKPPLLLQVAVETVSAQLMTVPVVMLLFGTYSNLGVLANILIVPLIPLIMLLTFITGLVVMALPAAAAIAGWPATILLNYVLQIIKWLSAVDWAQIEVTVTLITMLLMYGVICMASFVLWRKTKLDMRRSSITD